MKIVMLDKQEKKAIGGVGTYSAELIRFLERKGHEVIPVRYGDRRRPGDPPKTIILPYLAGNSSLYFIPKGETIRLIRKILLEQKPEVIHLNLGLSPLDFYIPRLASELAIPTVGIVHNGFTGEKISFGSLAVKSLFISYLPCLKNLNKVLVFSPEVKEFLIQNGIGKNNIVVLPNGVDAGRYTPGGSRFKKINKIPFAFLFLGRLDREKNPDLLIESFLKISPPPEQKLIVVGGGTWLSLEKKLRRKYGRHPQIIFTGAVVDTARKIDIIRAADVFVLPSIVEGMSLALLETMACGLAPVVSDAGNHCQVVSNAGVILDHTKLKEQLPIALQIFSKYPQLGKTLGQKARKIIVNNYNLENQIDRLIGIYQELALNHRKRKPREKSLLGRFFSFFRPLSKQVTRD